MCGILGYIGKEAAYPVIIDGLRRMEYRGYDSAGVCITGDATHLYKYKGDVNHLVTEIGTQPVEGTIGIGHTRWATHGEPSDVNAHPHISMHGEFAIVHNGIIENYAALKEKLLQHGYTFHSDTDSEVLVNLIEYIYLHYHKSFEAAVRRALSVVIGAYAICVYPLKHPDVLIAARLGSPLVIGVASGNYYIASDPIPISKHTRNIVLLEDGDLVVMTHDSIFLKKDEDSSQLPHVTTVDWEIEDSDLGNFAHYMLKEIHEQPNSIQDTCRGRVSPLHDFITLGGLYNVLPRLDTAKRIVIVACGTSFHAGLLGEYFLEDIARIPVEVEYASEFRYRNPIIGPEDVVLAISQSGETADTLAAIRLAKERGALVLGICNVVGSSIARETQAGVYTHAGPEIGVASTKAFTAQVAVLAMIALLLGYRRQKLTDAAYKEYIKAFLELPQKVAEILKRSDGVRLIAEQFYQVSNFLYLGRGYFFPVALEGALKLKEISYIHAEGYAAAEMKHGPIALIDENMPVVVLAAKDNSYEKVVSNIQEVKARHGRVIAIVTEGDTTLSKMADYCIEIPEAIPLVESILAVVPLQLLAYHIALLRGCNVDRPRNLAKSVTVE
ncbi:MAG: glutamine--fructose-6-phosphate transaminase (isomerizing) [Bacteroides sp.]